MFTVFSDSLQDVANGPLPAPGTLTFTPVSGPFVTGDGDLAIFPKTVAVPTTGIFSEDLEWVAGLVYRVTPSPNPLGLLYPFEFEVPAVDGTPVPFQSIVPLLVPAGIDPNLYVPGPPGAGGDPAALSASPLLDPIETLVGTTPWPVGVIGGVLYGAKADGTLHTSLDSGTTWALVVATAATSTIQRLWQLGNGEVLVHAYGQLLYSTGWATNPATATFAQSLTTAPRNTFFSSWSVHAVGSRVIAAEYDIYANQPWRCWVSTDYGHTFTLRLDLATVRDAGQLAHTHWHAVAVDAFRGLLWATNGDQDDTNQLWVSDNDGVTWTALTAPLAKKRITAILPMRDGILLGSDDGSNIGPPGVWRVNPDNFNDIRVLHVIESGKEGAAQIGTSVHTAPDGTGYMCFEGFGDQGSPSVIFASTSGRSVSEVWRDSTPDPANDKQRAVYAIYGPDADGTMHAWIASTLHAGWHLAAGTSRPGSPRTQRPVLAGNGDVAAGLAVGLASKAGVQSVAVGDGASAGKGAADSQRSVAVGYQATAGSDPTEPFGTAVGGLARAIGTSGTAIGYDAEANQGALAMGLSSRAGLSSTAIGPNAQATADNATSLGSGTHANFAETVSVGAFADTTGPQSVTIGYASDTNWKAVTLGALAQATHFGAVAIGHSTATSAADQVAIGPRHFELEEIADPGVAPANKARLFARDNGSGKTQIVAHFPSGAVVVIATEP